MRFSPIAIAAAALFTVGCLSAGEEVTSNEDPVSDLDTLLEGAPSNDELPDENKADAVYPSKLTELVALQSRVKSQGSRGVCSIFSTTALMEHLYIKEGTISDPDFSEQFLQWSVKFEVGAFPKTSGSNARSNLDAISRFGIVDETTYPYESFAWSTTHNADCDGSDDQPTICYTNGEPSDEVKNATRYKLPRGRWVGTHSIKAHMHTKKTAVVVGMTFFYQAWNHRRSELPRNTDAYAKGIVLYPNAKDKEISLEKRVGHSILLVGWDDDFEAPTYDEKGDPIVDEEGEPVMEKGFYIFKNSWGTGGFGRDNPYGNGYGYISMRYVREYGSAYVSDLPTVSLPEVCDDGTDNDRDGDTDCDDSDCAGHAACAAEPTSSTYTSTEAVAIPDNDPVGVGTTIEISDQLVIGSLKVHVDISHTYRGDLRVTLQRGETHIVLHDRDGSYQDDLVETYELADFNGQDLAGAWRLKVEDHASYDTGTLEGWSLEVVSAP